MNKIKKINKIIFKIFSLLIVQLILTYHTMINKIKIKIKMVQIMVLTHQTMIMECQMVKTINRQLHLMEAMIILLE